MNKINLSLIAFWGLCFPACSPRSLSVPQVNLVPQLKSETFPSPQNQTLRSNRIFLWPEHVTGERVAEVMRWGQEVQAAEDDHFLASEKEHRLREKLAEVVEIPIRIEKELAPKKNSIQRQLDFWKKRNHAEKTAEFERKLAEVDDEIQMLQAKLEESRQRIDPDGVLQEELRDVQVDFERSHRRGVAAVKQLEELVEMDVQGPDEIRLNTRWDGQLSVSVDGWAPRGEGEKRNFSTDDGSILNATYQEFEGRVSFTVWVNERIQYRFTLHRSDYAKSKDPRDGRVFYSGEVWRDEKGFEPRKGVAKWVDRAS
jgi:hypothetical protein